MTIQRGIIRTNRYATADARVHPNKPCRVQFTAWLDCVRTHKGMSEINITLDFFVKEFIVVRMYVCIHNV